MKDKFPTNILAIYSPSILKKKLDFPILNIHLKQIQTFSTKSHTFHSSKVSINYKRGRGIGDVGWGVEKKDDMAIPLSEENVTRRPPIRV